MSPKRSRVLAGAVAVGGAALIAWYCTQLPTDGLPVAIVILVALVWSTLEFTLNAVVGAGPGPGEVDVPPHDGDGPTDADVTIVVVATDDDPDEVVRTAVALAQTAGPVVLVDLADTPRRGLAASLDVHLAAGDATQAAIDAALGRVETTCVAVVRARACVVADELHRAAGLITGDVGWVTGRTEAYNDDGFSPAHGRSISDALRTRARRRGLAIWATDATVVRTEAAVAAGGFRSDRPWGSILRRMATTGFHGVSHDGVISAIAAPAEAEPFWRIRVAEARADAAEATDAFVDPGARGPSRKWARAGAAGLLMRDLRGWVMLAWILAIGAVAATGVAPVASQVWLWTGLVVVYAAARGGVAALQSGLPSDAGAELVSAVYEFPISLSATAGLARRAAPVRAVSTMASLVPSRLLAWVALLVTLCLTIGVLELVEIIAVESSSQQAWGIAGSLAVLAAFGTGIWRSHTMRRSGRVSFRFPVTLPVEIGGRPGCTEDISPGGLRVRGDFPPLAVGSQIAIAVDDEHAPPELLAEVRWMYPDGDATVAGLSLTMDDKSLAQWTRTVFAAADVLRPRPAAEVPAPA